MAETPTDATRHFTLRRGFAVFLGLVVLALYFIWAAYGAAPTSLSFLTESSDESPTDAPMAGTAMAGMAMGGHGGGGGMTPEEFAELTEQFVEAFSLPDGSVKPGRMPMAGMSDMPGTEHAEGTEAGHGATDMRQGMAMADSESHGTAEREHAEPATAGGHAEGEGGHGSTDMAMGTGIPGAAGDREAAHGHDGGVEPIDVYLMAVQFSYVPSVLRLEHGVPYRFHMMSTDVNHGASIHTGFVGHIMRRPAGTLVNMVMTFDRPGEYMVYCTVYCGDGHDSMKGKIIVE